jgi:hypothetical protein
MRNRPSCHDDGVVVVKCKQSSQYAEVAMTRAYGVPMECSTNALRRVMGRDDKEPVAGVWRYLPIENKVETVRKCFVHMLTIAYLTPAHSA